MAADPRYPIGLFEAPAAITPAERTSWIRTLADCPARIRAAIDGLTDSQLDTPYRDGGWTVRQLIHHVPDSHMNAYVRFKIALTEEDPLIRPYDENLWAELPEARIASPEVSLRLLEGIHGRWVLMLEAMGDAEFSRIYWHPEIPDGPVRLDAALGTYAWHCRHHEAHITELRKRMGW